MKTCPTSLRQNAYKSYKGQDISEKDKIVIDKFFKYLEAYCAEMKCTELDIFLNDENWENVFHLFENIMLKDKVVT
jgi:hypothetical protein